MIRIKHNVAVFTPRTGSRLLICGGMLLTCILLSAAVSATATDANKPPSPSDNGEPKFAYQLEGRPDPFVPFITEKAASSNVDMNEIVEANEPLTGMQLFEPGQLTLVALLTTGPSNTAMVEDFTGKGYLLNEGTKIGRRGVVKNIAPNKVIIEETAVTRAGKKIISEVVMILKKEGEE